jgi:protein-S-isoprenylcysteine O-methyltransferase Ste14
MTRPILTGKQRLIISPMISRIELILLITFTLCNIAFNWYISLRAERFHAIFRFFSFESIFLLILINYPVWFRNPLSFQQLISWVLLIICIYGAVIGFYTYYKLGKPEDLLEETIHIISSGIYKYIRHPMYMSLIAFGLGAMMKDPGYVQLLIGVVNLIAVYFTVRVEEKEIIVKFGEAYSTYMKKTKMFIPFII